MTHLFDVAQECLHVRWADLLQCQLIERLVALVGEEWQEKAERIAVTLLGLAREIALTDEVFEEEAADPGAQ
jgi:hypothetical protein